MSLSNPTDTANIVQNCQDAIGLLPKMETGLGECLKKKKREREREITYTNTARLYMELKEHPFTR